MFHVKQSGGENITKIKTAIAEGKAWQELLVMSNDEYSAGMYNGIEKILSILENRSPSYIVYAGPEKKEEKTEQIKRTGRAGIRRLKNGS